MTKGFFKYSKLGAVGTLLVFLALPKVGRAQTFSGEGTAVKATVLGVTSLVSDTGALPSSGDAFEASLIGVSVPNLISADAPHATTIGLVDTTGSEASLANLGLTVAGNNISAAFVMGRASAALTFGSTAVSGDSDVEGLVINGAPVAVTGAPNQQVSLLTGGTVIISEQVTSQSSVTVNALHVIIPGVADVVVCSTSAGVW